MRSPTALRSHKAAKVGFEPTNDLFNRQALCQFSYLAMKLPRRRSSGGHARHSTSRHGCYIQPDGCRIQPPPAAQRTQSGTDGTRTHDFQIDNLAATPDWPAIPQAGRERFELSISELKTRHVIQLHQRPIKMRLTHAPEWTRTINHTVINRALCL